jgi:hypothetical protein
VYTENLGGEAGGCWVFLSLVPGFRRLYFVDFFTILSGHHHYIRYSNVPYFANITLNYSFSSVVANKISVWSGSAFAIIQVEWKKAKCQVNRKNRYDNLFICFFSPVTPVNNMAVGETHSWGKKPEIEILMTLSLLSTGFGVDICQLKSPWFQFKENALKLVILTHIYIVLQVYNVL